jgi:hypothetical protein
MHGTISYCPKDYICVCKYTQLNPPGNLREIDKVIISKIPASSTDPKVKIAQKISTIWNSYAFALSKNRSKISTIWNSYAFALCSRI